MHSLLNQNFFCTSDLISDSLSPRKFQRALKHHWNRNNNCRDTHRTKVQRQDVESLKAEQDSIEGHPPHVCRVNTSTQFPQPAMIVQFDTDLGTKSNILSDTGHSEKGSQDMDIKSECELDPQAKGDEQNEIEVKTELEEENVQENSDDVPLSNELPGSNGLHSYPEFMPLTSYLLERQSKLLLSETNDIQDEKHLVDLSGPQSDVGFNSSSEEIITGDIPGVAIGELNPEKRKRTGNTNNGRGGLCPVCSKYITRIKNMKLHMRTHTGERPYVCKICNSKFSNASMLQIHTRTHTGEKPYKCEICNSRFAVKSHLRRHSQTHTNEKPYECDYCQIKFTYRSYLDTHLKIHTGEKPFVCDFCNKGFSRNSVLNRHLRSHTGEKPHECDVCFKNFADKSKLLIHSRIHTGERPYECNLCPSKFSDASRLKVHMRTHTGEKPYECHVCQRPFSDKSNLRSHMIHTHEKKAKDVKNETS